MCADCFEQLRASGFKLRTRLRLDGMEDVFAINALTAKDSISRDPLSGELVIRRNIAPGSYIDSSYTSIAWSGLDGIGPYAFVGIKNKYTRWRTLGLHGEQITLVHAPTQTRIYAIKSRALAEAYRCLDALKEAVMLDTELAEEKRNAFLKEIEDAEPAVSSLWNNQDSCELSEDLIAYQMARRLGTDNYAPGRDLACAWRKRVSRCVLHFTGVPRGLSALERYVGSDDRLEERLMAWQRGKPLEGDEALAKAKTAVLTLEKCVFRTKDREILE